MRKQTKLTFNMGSEYINDGFRRHVIKAACACSGGCFVPTGTGYWIEGQTHAERFDGPIEREETLVIELTCEQDKVEGVYLDMKNAIAEAAYRWACAVNWVHVTELEMTGRHFSAVAVQRENMIAAE